MIDLINQSDLIRLPCSTNASISFSLSHSSGRRKQRSRWKSSFL